MSNGQTFDVIVIGLGGMGSAAAYHLAARGQRVLGLEQYTSPHDQGSSHGSSRVIRQAYYEDTAYVPLLLRAYELWHQLERDTGRDLLTLTGGLMMGQPGSSVVTGSIRSAKEHNLPHEILDANQIRKCFPPIQPSPDTVALFEMNAGFIRPEESIKAHLDRAQQLGATLRFEEEVLAWEPMPNRVRVTTGRNTYEAGRLIITAGPWAPSVLAELGIPLEVERQVLYWFDPIGGIEPFLPSRFPVFIYENEEGLQPYGIPAAEGEQGGVKVSFYRGPIVSKCTPQTIDREVHLNEIELMRRAISQFIPSLNSELLNAVTCMYTNTPDKNFVIGLHPQHQEVTIAAGFSGHGFKFCSVVGEILADLAVDGKTRHDIALFNPLRFEGNPIS